MVASVRHEAADWLLSGFAVPVGQPHCASELAASERPAVEARASPQEQAQHSACRDMHEARPQLDAHILLLRAAEIAASVLCRMQHPVALLIHALREEFGHGMPSTDRTSHSLI